MIIIHTWQQQKKLGKNAPGFRINLKEVVVFLVCAFFLISCDLAVHSAKGSGNWVLYTGYTGAYRFTEDNHGEVWVGTQDDPREGYIIRPVGGQESQAIHFPHDPDPYGVTLRVSMGNFAFDSQGAIWVFFWPEDNLFRRKVDGQWVIYSDLEHPELISLKHLAIDNQGRAFVDALLEDVYIISPETGKITATGLKGIVVDMVSDKQGRIWVLQKNHGGDQLGWVKMYLDGQWKTVVQIRDAKRIFIADNGTIWVRTSRGMSWLNSDGQWQEYGYQWFPKNSSTDFTVDQQGRAWLATDQGVWMLDVNVGWTKFTMANSSIPDNYISCVFIDSKNRLWVGAGQIAMLDLNTFPGK